MFHAHTQFSGLNAESAGERLAESRSQRPRPTGTDQIYWLYLGNICEHLMPKRNRFRYGKGLAVPEASTIRTRRCPPERRVVLQRVAVIGRFFLRATAFKANPITTTCATCRSKEYEPLVA